MLANVGQDITLSSVMIITTASHCPHIRCSDNLSPAALYLARHTMIFTPKLGHEAASQMLESNFSVQFQILLRKLPTVQFWKLTVHTNQESKE